MTFTAPATPRGRTRRQGAIRTLRTETLPTFAELRRNLLTVIASATDDAETEGLAWYGAAHSIAADLATRYGLTVRQTAGVLAALSPQTGWAENIRLASEACAAGTAEGVGHYDDAEAKATAILGGADPADVLGGRKVRSFFANISHPHRVGPVTVDRHCVDALFGRRGAVNSRILERVGAYTLCASVIRSVARELGYRPHDLQAIAWVAWRQTHDVAYRYDADF